MSISRNRQEHAEARWVEARLARVVPPYCQHSAFGQLNHDVKCTRTMLVVVPNEPDRNAYGLCLRHAREYVSRYGTSALWREPVLAEQK